MSETKDTRKKWMVYIHQNLVNGKRYVGITSCKDPNMRWQNGNGYKEHNKYFYSSIQKYGWDTGFSHEIVASDLSEHDAKEMEKNLIKEYQSNNREYGYNLTKGGDYTRKPVSQFTLEGDFIREFPSLTKAAKFVNGKKSDIRSVCVGKSALAYGYGWCYSVDCPDLDKFKLEYMKRIENNNKVIEYRKTRFQKKVYQLDDNGNIIAEFASASDASRYFDLCNASAIANACKNHYKSSGYYWSYAENYDEILENGFSYFLHPMKYYKVLQFDMDGNLLKEFDNCYAASESIGCLPFNIKRACVDSPKPVNGYLWRFKEKYNGEKIRYLRHINNQREVAQFSLDGDFIATYDSITLAAKATGNNAKNIGRVCNNITQKTRGFTWRFLDECEPQKDGSFLFPGKREKGVKENETTNISSSL